MRRLGIGVLAGLVAAVVAAPGTAQADTCAGAGDPLTANTAQSERTLLCLTNIHRAGNGAGPLAMDPVLQQTARDYSADMRARNYFNHFGGPGCDTPPPPPLQAGCSYPWDRAQAHGFPSDQVGENLARGFLPTPQDVFNGFRNSPGHNANMLDPAWVVAGMGISGGPYITELFSSHNTGATDTAVDLLITDECVAARNQLAPLEQDLTAKQAALDAANDKLEKAKNKSKKKKRKAKKKVKQAEEDLKKAQAALAAAQASAQAQCAASSY